MKLTGSAIIACIAALMAQSSMADTSPLKPVRQLTLPNGLPLTQYTLANGLNLYVIENHSAPVFTYQTWFNVGSKDEQLDPQIAATGLAHLFEHMMFRGTKSHPDGQFDEILSENGATDENATTWVDRTNYYESVPVAALPLVMQLESDRMTNLSIDSTLLTTEKSAVVGELNMGLDDPTTVAYEQLYNAAYTVHPYKYSTIGTEAEINGFTVDQANYFYKKYYAPSNATILVVGDVSPAVVAAGVQLNYGAIPMETVTHLPAPVEPAQTAEREAQFTHPQLQQTRILIGHHIPGVKDPDFPALWVLQSALSYGQTSLLELAWVNAGITVSVQGDINQFEDPGLLILGGDIQAGHQPADAENALDQVLGNLESQGADSILSRAQNQLLLHIYSQLEDNASLASFLGEYIPTAGDPVFGFNLIQQIQNVTSADVLRVAEKYLTPANRTVVVGTPASKKGSPQ